jgi:hypothetical protein
MTEAREELNDLSKSLLQIHKILLTIQKEQEEGIHHRQLSPQQLLQALFSNPEFEWLRVLSTVAVRIDEVVDDKEALHASFLAEIRPELRQIFGNNSDKYADFQHRLQNALLKDAQLQKLVASLRQRLEDQ